MDWAEVFIDVPAADADRAVAFWAAALGWDVGTPWADHPEFRSLLPPTGDTYASVQTIDGPPRVHLDLTVPDPAAEARRLATLGATIGDRHDHWQVMASPGGLPFCLVLQRRDHHRPGATTWDDGHRSRLVQFCVDAPRARVEAETRFWREATGWDFTGSRSAEFTGRLRPPCPGSLQILVQELGDTDRGELTRAHLDLGSDDVAAEVYRLSSLGATQVRQHPHWIVLRDPAGLAFCVTDNDPDAPTA